MVQISWDNNGGIGSLTWEYWLNDGDGFDQFKIDFAEPAKKLGKDMLVEPHWYFVEGEYFGCTGGTPNDRPCTNQCTNSGKYCQVDPDGDTEFGISGADLVRENMRQYCIFKVVNGTGIHDAFWNYLSAFSSECVSASGDKRDACSSALMRRPEVNIPQAKVDACLLDCNNGQGTQLNAEGGENKCIKR
jgi:hypothetical protein